MADSVTVRNDGAAAADVLVYPVDATIGSRNAFAMMPANSLLLDAGRWLQLDSSGLSIPPHAERIIHFQFSVPTTASVGAHYGGIIIQPVTPEVKNTSGYAVHIVSRLGVRLYETVPGKQQPGLQVTDWQRETGHHDTTVTVTVKNTGNTTVAPRGQLEIKDILGQPVANGTLSSDLLEPGGTTTIRTTVPVSNNLPGRFVATATFDYDNHRLAARKETFITGDRSIFIWLGVVILSLCIAFRLFRRGLR